MGEQVGVLSAFQLGIHDHLSNERGGILNAYSRDGSYRVPISGGAEAIHFDNDASRNTMSDVMIMLKETVINVDQDLGVAGANIALRYQMKNLAAGGNVQAQSRVLRGVVPVFAGALNTMNSNVWTDYVDLVNVNLRAGDRIQIFARRTAAETCFLQLFRLRWDWRLAYFGDGTRNLLTTVLPLNDVDVLDFTAVT